MIPSPKALSPHQLPWISCVAPRQSFFKWPTLPQVKQERRGHFLLMWPISPQTKHAR
ncbi:hypothetical protein BC567DRAFT_218084 [Phyllosticta citribraziliensis]